MPNKNELSPGTAFFVESNGRQYFLCSIQIANKNVYFFSTNVNRLPEGSRQVSLPSGYQVSTEHGLPQLVKKAAEEQR